MRARWLWPWVLVLMSAPGVASEAGPPVAEAQPPVVLLHGLNRMATSMAELARALEGAGRRTVNLDYPSGQHDIDTLAAWVLGALDACCGTALEGGVDFVTHSLGGIVVREMHRQRPALAVRRVVMIAPPNAGSELVEALGKSALFRLVTGPAGQELGTGAASVPNRLGPVRFELGVIAGTTSLNPVYSWVIPGEDDGTVAVARTRVEGMVDFVTVQANHTFIMQDARAIRQAVHFIENGRFER